MRRRSTRSYPSPACGSGMLNASASVASRAMNPCSCTERLLGLLGSRGRLRARARRRRARASARTGALVRPVPGGAVARGRGAEPDRVCLIEDGAVDELADPPDRVGRELGAPPPVEALVARIRPSVPSWMRSRRGCLALCSAGDGDDEAEVRADQPLLRLLRRLLDPLRQLHFLRPREQPVAGRSRRRWSWASESALRPPVRSVAPIACVVVVVMPRR